MSLSTESVVLSLDDVASRSSSDEDQFFDIDNTLSSSDSDEFFDPEEPTTYPLNPEVPMLEIEPQPTPTLWHTFRSFIWGTFLDYVTLDIDEKGAVPRVERTTCPLNTEIPMINIETQPTATPALTPTLRPLMRATSLDHVTLVMDGELTSPGVGPMTCPFINTEIHMRENETQTTPRPTALARTLDRIRSFMSPFNSPRSSNSGPSEIQPADRIGTVNETRKIRKKMAIENRNRCGALRAIEGIRFISKTCKGDISWDKIETNFDKLAKLGFLHRTDFPKCIGMDDSKQFALEMFDTLSLSRRRVKVEEITKDELYAYWSKISDKSFHPRLRLFFDMADKNKDGRLTKDEVKEIIVLSASVCKLSRIKDKAEEHAALIMEELDTENFGYIKIWQLETSLLKMHPYYFSDAGESFQSKWGINSLRIVHG